MTLVERNSRELAEISLDIGMATAFVVYIT